MIRFGWLLAAGTAAVLAAPAGTAEDPVIRVTVNLVQVDAVVTDSKGRQVTGLGPDDFEIIEDGLPQKIANFSYIRLAETPRPAGTEAPAVKRRGDIPPPPAARPAMKREDVRRTIALVVDDLGMSFESVAGVRRDLKRFVEERIPPGDMVAIIPTSGGMGALEQFTGDRRLLLEAVDRLRYYPNHTGVSVWEPVGNTGAGHSKGRVVDYSLGTLGAISYLVNGMREMPGRKSIILVSDGMAPTQQVMDAMFRLSNQANRSGVVVYSIDARGLQTVDPSGPISGQLALLRMPRGPLDYLARLTGGFLVQEDNRIDDAAAGVLEDLRGYYLIGYKPDPARFQPQNGKQADFHAIKVQVRVPGLQVRSRAGYYGYEDTPKSAEEQFAGALFSPFASTGLRVRLTAVFSVPAASPARIALMLHIDARDLGFSEEAGGLHVATADLAAFTVNERGVPVDKAMYKAVIGLKPEEYEYALRAGVVYTRPIPAARPGPYHVRVAVRDWATGKIGTASQFMDVPDLKKRQLALSGLVVGSPAGRPRDVEAPGLPSWRVFRRGGVLDFACQIFNARLGRGTNRPGIDTEVRVFRDGKQVLAAAPKRLAVAPGDSRRTTARGSLRLDSFEPGSYVLQFIVRDTLAKDKYATGQWVDFDVIQ